VLKTPVLMHAIFTAKNAKAHVHARLSNGAETSLPWKLLRTILSLVQALCTTTEAVVCRTPTCCLDEIGRSTLLAQENNPNPR